MPPPVHGPGRLMLTHRTLTNACLALRPVQLVRALGTRGCAVVDPLEAAPAFLTVPCLTLFEAVLSRSTTSC